MKTSDFNYTLDPALIAQHPTPHREECRLLVLDKDTGEMTHDHFYHLNDYLNPGDCLIVNDTRVIPARLFGHRPDREERIETLLLKRLEADRWECLVRPGKKMKIGTEIVFSGELSATVVDILDGGQRVLDFSYDGVWEEILERVGSMPTPPYITEQLKDPNDYQTVYAKVDGSAAAPTAGLHFTEEMMTALEKAGIAIGKLTLHVGLGTFRPVSEENIEEHPMHAEYYILPQKTVDLIHKTQAQGGRVISVGTTSTRTLETVAQKYGRLQADSGWTDIFIYPGYTYRAIDGIITNFHLPESTLIMMIAALVGRERILHTYEVANALRYRFFSFGDAMLILSRNDALRRNAEMGVVRNFEAFFDSEHDAIDLEALGVATEES